MRWLTPLRSRRTEAKSSAEHELPISTKNRIYQRLPILKGEIRLCTILDGTEGMQPCCVLRVVKLLDRPQYICLSYAWGEGTTREILLDGVSILVTPNLHEALVRLREKGILYDLWIDAICIDQIDIAEKNDQVAMMGRIYGDAKEVIISLYDVGGEGGAGGDQAASGHLEYEIEITGAVDFLYSLARGNHFHDLARFGACPSASCPSTKGAPEASWPDCLEGLKTVMDAKWFQRTWTIQEVVLAKEASVLVGAYRIPWSIIAEAWVNFARHLNSCCGECIFALTQLEVDCLHRFACGTIDLVNATRRLEYGQNLLQPLLRFHSREPKDKRDKVYGLLGLQSGEDIVKIKPDYTLSLQQVYVDFAIQLVRSQGWLVPLHLDHVHNLVGLPSWVPDWTCVSTDPSDYTVARFTASSTYHASDGLEGDFSFANPNTLEVSGFELDRIRQLSCPYRLMETPSEQLQLVLDWRQFLNLEVRGEESYVAGGTLMQAYKATMFANRFHRSGECRVLRPDDVDAWHNHLVDTTRRLREEGPNAILKSDPAMSSHIRAVLRRRLFTTSKGYIGVCPESAQIEDRVAVLYHCPALIFLRPVPAATDSRARSYMSLGHGYVHGLMDGEAVRMGLPRDRFLIV